MIKFLKQRNTGFTHQNFQKKISGGFTLVETLIAISIFSVSIVAMMSILGRGISDVNYAKKKLTASYLAQEGIEYVRNMRDNAVLYTDITGNDWATFRDGTLASITPSPPVDSSFTRAIQKIVINPNEVKIYSTVSWNQGSGPISISLTENLFNWVEQ